VKYARTYNEFQRRGAEITAICVDTPEQNQAMIDKLLLPFHILSDPEGELAIKTYGIWNEQGRIAVPAVVAVAQDRTIRYLYTGQDLPTDRETKSFYKRSTRAICQRSDVWRAVIHP